jgi:hypothetical protein
MKAMKSPTLAPPKPQFKGFKSLYHMVVRRLVPFIDALRALEKEMLASDRLCDTMQDHGKFTSVGNCSTIDFSRAFERRSVKIYPWPTSSKFPLLSHEKMRLMRLMSAKFPIITIAIGSSLFFALFYNIAILTIVRRSPRRLEPISNEWSDLRVSLMYLWGNSWVEFIQMSSVCIWLPGKLMAKDTLIEICMSHKVCRNHPCMLLALSSLLNLYQALNLDMPAECLQVFALSWALSPGAEIRAWSIWRGYFFAMINQYSIDNFIFVSTLLAFVWSLYILWPAFCGKAGFRYSSRRRYDGYFSGEQDVEAPQSGEKI